MVFGLHVSSILCSLVLVGKNISGGLAMRAAQAAAFSVKVAAEQLGLSERTVHSVIKRGDLKVVRVGKRVLIRPSALQEFLDQRAEQQKAGAR
jgi:excisionase family DNA binding protein